MDTTMLLTFSVFLCSCGLPPALTGAALVTLLVGARPAVVAGVVAGMLATLLSEAACFFPSAQQHIQTLQNVL
jgi:hypothetical protein